MKDLYQDLLRYYCFAIGELPDKDKFLQAMKETVTREELRVFFLLPFNGSIAEKKLLSRARRAGIDEKEFNRRATRLVEQGMIMRYTRPGGRTYERGNIVHMSEQ
jgi:hypothetical protein